MVRFLFSAAVVVAAVISVAPQPQNDAAKSLPNNKDQSTFPAAQEHPGRALAWLHPKGQETNELSEAALARASRIARSSGNLLLERIYLDKVRRDFGARSPISASLTRRLAENAIERGDPSSTVRLLTTSLPSDGTADREGLIILANAYRQMSRREEAGRLYTELIDGDPKPLTPDDSSYAATRALDEMGSGAQISAGEHRRRAEIYQFHRDVVPARRHLEAWAAAEPASEPAAFLTIGRGYALAGEYGEAVKFYERLLERHPESPEAKDALLRLAGAYSRVGKVKEALSRYQSFIAKYPNDEMLDRAYLNQVDLFRDEADVTSALKWCDRTISTFHGKAPEAVARYSKARIHLTREEWQDALAELDLLATFSDLGGTAIPGGTSVQEVAFLRGIVLEKLARYTEAVAVLLSIPDGRNEYYGGLATKKLRSLSAAKASAEAVDRNADELAAELGSKDRGARRSAALRLIRLVPVGDRHDRALSVLKTAARSTDPVNTKLRSAKRPIVDALLRAGAYEDAADLLASTTPELADVDVLIKGGRADKALQILEPIWNKVPPDSPVELLGRARLRQLFPVVFRLEILAAAKKDAVDPRLVLAIMRQESRFDPSAHSNAGARGLMQFISTTAREVERKVDVPGFQQDDLYDPEIAIMFGSRHLADLFHIFPGQTEAVVAAYNAGEDNMSRWLARARSSDPARYVPEIMFTQTKDYVYRVMTNLEMYQTLYDEELRPIGDVHDAAEK